MEIERGSTRSNSVENSLWKRILTCHKTDCRMIKYSQLADCLILPEALKTKDTISD